MNLSTNSIDEIHKVLNNRALGWLFPVLETGEATCKQFMSSNSCFFDNTKFLNNVPGNLLTFSINRQVEEQCKLSSSPFIMLTEIINERNGYTIPILRNGNIRLSLLRSTKRLKIDNSNKKYLNNKCKKNNILNNQLSLFENIEVSEEPFHGILLYGTDKSLTTIKFADIVFFNDKLSTPLYSIDLLGKFHIYENSILEDYEKDAILSPENIIRDYIKENSIK